MNLIYLISSLFLALVGGGHHLPTYECSLDVAVVQNQSQTLCFTADSAISAGEFTDYKIKKEGRKVYISLYFNLFNVFPHQFQGVFNYTPSDDVDEIYLRGKNSEDVKLIWCRR